MSQSVRVLLTGATGFIGRHLIAHIMGKGHVVSVVSRKTASDIDGRCAVQVVGDLASNNVPISAFVNTDVVVHLAGHATSKNSGPIEESLNVRMARVVVARAREAGVPKVLVLSSIAATVLEKHPDLARRYGEEKLAADKVFLANLEREQRLVIVRPPAVYGPGMGGALATLSKIIAKGLPLPFGQARAPRNYMSVYNLISLLDTIIGAPDMAWARANRQIFNVADARLVHTDALIQMIAQAMGCSARQISIPLPLLRIAARTIGKTEMISGAFDALDIANNTPATHIFGWRPTEVMPESLTFLGRRDL